MINEAADCQSDAELPYSQTKPGIPLSYNTNTMRYTLLLTLVIPPSSCSRLGEGTEV